MRPMTLLASVVYPSLVLATLQVACSSDSTSPATLTPFDSGTFPVPAPAVPAGAVTLTVVGKGGTVVSSDGFPSDGGPNGYRGVDGGSPEVDCVAPAQGACTATQGTVLYANPTTGYVFSGWAVQGAEGGAIISTDNNLTVSPGIGNLTATFVAASNGADAAPPPPPPPVPDAGGAG